MLRFCSACGSDRISIRIPEGESTERVVCDNCGKIHYVNPRLIVGCLPVYKDKILVCKRAIDPCSGKWNLPAGFMEVNESAEEGAIRETLEEANAKVEIIRLHCVYSIPQVNQVYLIFKSKLLNPDFSPGPESSEVSLFDEKDMPWNDIAFTSSVYAIKKYFENRNNPNPETFIGGHTYDHRF